MEDERRSPRHLTEKDNLSDLIARMRPDDLELYKGFGHIFTEAAFINRRFFVVKTKGKDRSGRPARPEVLGTIRVIGFQCDHEKGSVVTIMDDSTSKILQVGHVPVRLFRFPVFVSVPVYQGLKWEAKEQPDGRYTRSLVFGLCFKQQSHVQFLNPNNVSVLTPNNFEKLFGEAPRLGV